MELFKRRGNREQKFKSAFKQLLYRMEVKGESQVKSRASSLTIDYDDRIDVKLKSPASISFGNAFPLKMAVPESKAFKVTTFQNKKVGPSSQTKPLPIKGSLSNRHKKYLTIQKKMVNSQIQKYNQLLITKSYIFSEGVPPKKKPGTKGLKTQFGNFQTRGDIKSFKRSRLVGRYGLANEQDIGRRRHTEFFDRYDKFQPWETEKNNDLF